MRIDGRKDDMEEDIIVVPEITQRFAERKHHQFHTNEELPGKCNKKSQEICRQN